jgi:hypothetical protein
MSQVITKKNTTGFIQEKTIGMMLLTLLWEISTSTSSQVSGGNSTITIKKSLDSVIALMEATLGATTMKEKFLSLINAWSFTCVQFA